MPSIPLETKEIQQEEPGEFANEAVDAWEGWRSIVYQDSWTRRQVEGRSEKKE